MLEEKITDYNTNNINSQNFVLSTERINSFNNCYRKYYWDYYGTIAFNKETTSEKIKKAGILKYLKSDEQLILNICRKTVNHIIENSEISEEYAKQYAVELLRKSWLEHFSNKWQQNSKRFTGISSAYYGIISQKKDEQRNVWANTIKKQIMDFLTKIFLENIPELLKNRDEIVGIDALHYFNIGTMKCYITFDFAMFSKETKILKIYKIIPKNYNIENDVNLMSNWVYNNNQDIISESELNYIFIDENANLKLKINEQLAKDQFHKIIMKVEQMQDLLINKDIFKNEAINIEKFEQNKLKCSTCNYRELCQ